MNNDWVTGLNMPNKMYPGTWVLVGVVLAAILGGFTYLFVKWLKSRVPWKRLPQNPALRYYGKDHEPSASLIYDCWLKTQELFVKHCTPVQPKWTKEAVSKALGNLRVYVMNADKWPEVGTSGTLTGRTIAGWQAAYVIAVGKNLAAFLHECAHRCEEVIDRERDMDHLTWVKDGIRAADDEFSAWLATQKIL